MCRNNTTKQNWSCWSNYQKIYIKAEMCFGWNLHTRFLTTFGEATDEKCHRNGSISISVYHIGNPSWLPMWNGVHLSEFVFQRSQAIASDFRGIQTPEGQIHSTWAPMIDSISSTMFSSCDNFTKTSEITLKSSEITVRGQNSQLSVDETQFNIRLYYSDNCSCKGGTMTRHFTHKRHL